MMEHGGNIYRASQETGIPEGRIIDFSASINPLGIPLKVISEIKKHIGQLPHYPEPYAERLCAEIGLRLGIDPDSIICGNGSTELIYLVARVLRPERALIPAPTFSEYERACRSVPGTGIARHEMEQKKGFDVSPERFIRGMRRWGMAFLCNPNNPTGRLVEKNIIMKIAEAARELQCYLIVDEAFIDFSPSASVIKEVRGNPFLIVLRSMTKFYALSGLRIGYGVFPLPLAKVVKKFKEPWTVNTLAQKAGMAALADRDYGRKTMRFIRQEKRFMERELANLGIEYLPSAANFYLLRMENAKEVVNGLMKKGMLVRDCSSFAGLDGSYLRVAVKSRVDNMALLMELSRL